MTGKLSNLKGIHGKNVQFHKKETLQMPNLHLIYLCVNDSFKINVTKCSLTQVKHCF